MTLKVEIRTGEIERTDVSRKRNSHGQERVEVSLWRKPYSERLQAHDRSADMVRVTTATLTPEEAREVAAALELAARTDEVV